jgi:hypothetical protein
MDPDGSLQFEESKINSYKIFQAFNGNFSESNREHKILKTAGWYRYIKRSDTF